MGNSWQESIRENTGAPTWQEGIRRAFGDNTHYVSSGGDLQSAVDAAAAKAGANISIVHDFKIEFGLTGTVAPANGDYVWIKLVTTDGFIVTGKYVVHSDAQTSSPYGSLDLHTSYDSLAVAVAQVSYLYDPNYTTDGVAGSYIFTLKTGVRLSSVEAVFPATWTVVATISATTTSVARNKNETWNNIQLIDVRPGTMLNVKRDPYTQQPLLTSGAPAEGVVILQDLEMETPFIPPTFDIPAVAVKTDDLTNTSNYRLATGTLLCTIDRYDSTYVAYNSSGDPHVRLTGYAGDSTYAGQTYLKGNYEDWITSRLIDNYPDYAANAVNRVLFFGGDGSGTGPTASTIASPLVHAYFNFSASGVSLANARYIAITASAINATFGQPGDIEIAFSSSANFGGSWSASGVTWLKVPPLYELRGKRLLIDISSSAFDSVRALSAKSIGFRFTKSGLPSNARFIFKDIAFADHPFMAITPIDYAAQLGIPVTHAAIVENVDIDTNTFTSKQITWLSLMKGNNFAAHPTLGEPYVDCTINATTDVVTDTSGYHGLHNGDVVWFRVVVTGGLQDGTPYYVVNATTSTFQVSDTLGGGVRNLVAGDQSESAQKFINATQFDPIKILGKTLGYRMRLRYLKDSSGIFNVPAPNIKALGYVQSGSAGIEPKTRSALYHWVMSEVRRWFKWVFNGTNAWYDHKLDPLNTPMSLSTSIANPPNQNAIYTWHNLADTVGTNLESYANWKTLIDNLALWQSQGKIICVSMDSLYSCNQPVNLLTATQMTRRTPGYIWRSTNASTYGSTGYISTTAANLMQIDVNDSYASGVVTDSQSYLLIPGRTLDVSFNIRPVMECDFITSGGKIHTATAHRLVVGDTVQFTESVGGVTKDTTYVVATVVDANNFTITGVSVTVVASTYMSTSRLATNLRAVLVYTTIGVGLFTNDQTYPMLDQTVVGPAMTPIHMMSTIPEWARVCSSYMGNINDTVAAQKIIISDITYTVK